MVRQTLARHAASQLPWESFRSPMAGAQVNASAVSFNQAATAFAFIG